MRGRPIKPMQTQPEENSRGQTTGDPLDLRGDAQRLLEFPLVRERLAGYASFPLAREMALDLSPSYELTEVVRRQAETAEARRFLETGASLDVAGAKDLRQPLQRSSLGGILTGEELRALGDTLGATRSVRNAILRVKQLPILEEMARELPVPPDLEKELAASIGSQGEVLDSASPGLRELRSEAQSAHQRLTDSLQRTVRRVDRHNILQEPIITQRNGRMVLLVKTEMKHRLPGIVHDVSDSGATLFVEPMACIGLGNRWRELKMAQEREEERVIRSLSSKVEALSVDLLLGLELLGRLDLAMAKARYAVAINATSPTVLESEQGYLGLTDARHPLLEGEVVPVSVNMGDGWSLLLITGPNAGGKTVALKTIGLLSLMAQAGLQTPAREVTIALFDGIYADIGDHQSIQRSLSTFGSHIQNIGAIMAQASSRSLVLIDELGVSTDPEEGAALAKALLRQFLQRRVTCVATTHQREVAAFVQEQPGMMNASVELDPATLAPTYRLTVGLPGRSYALSIATKLGLAGEIVEDARSLLSPVHRSAESLFKELQDERRLAAEKRMEAEAALAQVDGTRAELEEQLAAIRDAKSEMMEEARHQLQLKVDDVNRRIRELERLPMVHVPAPAPAQGIKQARKEVAQVRRELRSPVWEPPPSRRGDWLKQLRAGDRVYLRGVGQPVEVLTPPDEAGLVEVLMGSMRARLPVYQVDRLAGPGRELSRDTVIYSRRTKGQVSPELDLHGRRVEEALERVEGYLNDAVMAGLSSVRISHGVGTGALREAIREYLRGHALVKSAGPDEGMPTDGATVVELA